MNKELEALLAHPINAVCYSKRLGYLIHLIIKEIKTLETKQNNMENNKLIEKIKELVQDHFEVAFSRFDHANALITVRQGQDAWSSTLPWDHLYEQKLIDCIEFTKKQINDATTLPKAES